MSNLAFHATADRNADIYFIFEDGLALARGTEPVRAHPRLRHAVWRVVFAVFDVAIARLLFVVPWRRGLVLFAVFAALFWTRNRWTLFEILIGQIDCCRWFCSSVGRGSRWSCSGCRSR